MQWAIHNPIYGAKESSTQDQLAYADNIAINGGIYDTPHLVDMTTLSDKSTVYDYATVPVGAAPASVSHESRSFPTVL